MKNHSVETVLTQKKNAKIKLAKTMEISMKSPLVALFLDRDLEEKDLKRTKKLLEALRNLQVNVVVLGDKDLSGAFKGTKILNYARSNRKNLIEAADIALTFDFSDIEEMFIHGVVPVTRATDFVMDYNPNKEVGNAFVYKKDNLWLMFEATIRALEAYRFPYDWKHIVSQCMDGVYSSNPKYADCLI